jgi:hypothetical protein
MLRNRKTKAVFLILAAELVLLIVLGCLYSSREKTDLIFAQEELVNENGESAFYVDKSYGYADVMTPSVTLPRGMYTLEVEYDCVGDTRIEVCYAQGSYENDIAGDICVSASKHTLTCDFKVKYGNRPLYVQGRLSGDAVDGDYILIKNVHITTSTVNTRNFIFELFAFFLILDCILAVYFFGNKIFTDVETKRHIKVLLLTILLCSLPLTVNYLFGNAHDLKFHLTRIEGIKDGLLNGSFPVKLQSNWLGGQGYAVSVFYGDVLLYFPAVLRIFGVSIQSAYNLYVLLINVLTVMIAYHCFGGMSDKKTGLVCTILYSMNVFRLYDIYTRAAVGEYTAMAFMPLVMYGLWKVYKLPEDSKEHERSWLTIVAGCLGIFFAHMISTEMTALFVILAAVILWKKTFRKKNFMVLLKAAVVTVGLSLWFLVPFLDYMASGVYTINCPGRYEPYRLEDKGGFLVQFFMTKYDVMGASGGIGSRGVADNMPYTMGLAVMLILLGWFVLCMGENTRSKSEKKEEYLAVFLCLFSILLTMCIFPYTRLVEIIPVLEFPVHGLQFSWRFFAVAAVLFMWLLCIVMQKKWIEPQKKKIFAGVLIVLTMVQGLAVISEIMNEVTVYHIYQEGGLSTNDVVFGEYIPVADADTFHVSDSLDAYESSADELSYDESSLSVEEWHRDRGSLKVSVQNASSGVQQLEVPLILYKGYRAYDKNGEQLQITPGNYYRISVSVPAGYSGDISIGFYEPWYWRVCELLSLFILVLIVIHEVSIYLNSRRDGKEIEKRQNNG